METLASRAALVCGLAPKYWLSPGGLSGRWGLSIWSDGGSSLMPLSLGEGDQIGEPDTESLPVRRALRKSSSACSAGCSSCWVETISAMISLSVWEDDMTRGRTDKDLRSMSRSNYTVDTKQTATCCVWVTLDCSQADPHLVPGLARSDGCHGVLFPHDGECHRSDQTASQAAQCHHNPETRSSQLISQRVHLSCFQRQRQQIYNFWYTATAGGVLFTIHHDPPRTHTNIKYLPQAVSVSLCDHLSVIIMYFQCHSKTGICL